MDLKYTGAKKIFSVDIDKKSHNQQINSTYITHIVCFNAKIFASKSYKTVPTCETRNTRMHIPQRNWHNMVTASMCYKKAVLSSCVAINIYVSNGIYSDKRLW